MDVLNNLENVELLTVYQKNEIVVGTCLFVILYGIYLTVIGRLSMFEIGYMSVAFLLCYLTVAIFYNYISYFA
jgi:hypothetical protein